ncbi:MAG TPA: hypothetical protein VFZ23_05660 [Pyrinomonadaceae bacterium]
MIKITRYLLVAVAVMTLFSIASYGQTRKRPPAKRTTPAPRTVTQLPPLDVRAARVKVLNQLSNVGGFVQLLGPIAQAIEALDAEAKTNKRLSKQSLDKNAADKQKVVNAIRGIREGMVKLESEFRVKPALKRYLVTIQGISDLAGQSEQSAIAGKFVAANTPLRSIQQKLNDTLTAMPKAEL